MNRIIGFSIVCIIASAIPGRAATLAQRLGVPFGITANDGCGQSGAVALAAQVATIDVIIFQWSEMQALQPLITTRAAAARAAGLRVMLGMSVTALTGLRTDIDLPVSVATACGLTQNTASFASACLRDRLIADATTYAGAVFPDYFHLGTEVNTLVLRKLGNPADNEFAFFGALYQSAVPMIKAASSNTGVFTSFQYELQVQLEQDNPGAWDSLLNAFRGGGPSLMDFVGYTSYPASSGSYGTPSIMPVGYYAAAAAHLRAPERVVFTEIGWPTQGAAGSEAAQKTFLDRLPELMSSAKPSMVVWALLHDVPPALFGGNLNLATVGVRACNGSPKAGWAVLTGAAGPGSSPDPLGSIQAFPNPMRASQGHTTIFFTGLPSLARLRVYTLAGELVNDLSANSFGNASWDGKNAAGRSVASGVYIVYVQAEGKSKSLKVAVQR